MLTLTYQKLKTILDEQSKKGKIKLNNYQLNDEHIKIIENFILKNSNIKSLDLSKSKLIDKELKYCSLPKCNCDLPHTYVNSNIINYLYS